MSDINDLTCKSKEDVLRYLKMASKSSNKLQGKIGDALYLSIQQPIDAVITYLEAEEQYQCNTNKELQSTNVCK